MTTKVESEIKPSLANPVSNLFYRICGIVSNYIVISKPQFKEQIDKKTYIFNFDNDWEVEYKFYDSDSENKNFEIILRTLDIGNRFPNNEITLTLFNDGETNITLRHRWGNKPNFSSRDIKSEKELRDKISQGSSMKIFADFPELDLNAILEVGNII